MPETPGTERMKEVRRELRRNSTRAEDILWQRVRGHRLGCKFRRQHSIGGYIADFYCAEASLIVEIDGEYHEQDEQKKYDAFRQECIENFHYRILRFKNADVELSLEKVISEIRAAIDRQ